MIVYIYCSRWTAQERNRAFSGYPREHPASVEQRRVTQKSGSCHPICPIAFSFFCFFFLLDRRRRAGPPILCVLLLGFCSFFLDWYCRRLFLHPICPIASFFFPRLDWRGSCQDPSCVSTCSFFAFLFPRIFLGFFCSGERDSNARTPRHARTHTHTHKHTSTHKFAHATAPKT